MSAKFLFLHMLLASAALSAVQLEAGGSSPVIHIISAVTGSNSPINIQIKAGVSLSSLAHQLRPGEDYQINVDVKGVVYYTTAVFGLKFTDFHAYEPARDKGRAAVYWRADNSGFAISYDKTNWKEVAPWESG